MPDIHSAAQAKAYARELWLTMKYADVTDGDLYHGHVRFDVNISLSKDPAKLGTRSEIKNLNSFRSVEAAVAFEIKRQSELLDKGQKIVQETRGWDEAKQKSISQRSKEEAEDYRYMPEPDIPPLELDDEYIKKIKADIPVLPAEWRRRFVDLGYDKAQIETLLDIHADIPEQGYLPFIEQRLKEPDFAKFVANVIMNVYEPFRTGDSSGNRTINSKWQVVLPQVYELVKAGKLSSTKYKQLILDLNKIGGTPNVESYAKEHDFIQVSDEKEIEKIVAEVIAENPKPAQDVKNGEMKAIGFLVGQVMAKSKGQANPQLAQKLIIDKLKSK
jgi:aspartyl-tRNA(Asn)/glutamyl-tRNA(Gln) amidotransferase subunit B